MKVDFEHLWMKRFFFLLFLLLCWFLLFMFHLIHFSISFMPLFFSFNRFVVCSFYCVFIFCILRFFRFVETCFFFLLLNCSITMNLFMRFLCFVRLGRRFFRFWIQFWNFSENFIIKIALSQVPSSRYFIYLFQMDYSLDFMIFGSRS